MCKGHACRMVHEEGYACRGGVHPGGACVQGGQTLPPPPVDTATEAGGKHPTGMHSCLT